MPRILIIEDDASNRALLERILAAEGHSIIAADNGAVGLTELARNEVDLVVTDIVMPGIEGIEIIREIRRLLPGIKIIAVSGVHPLYLEAVSQLGANAVLRKPFRPAELREIVARVLAEP
jgi:CheY-like chemotaxis protein